jgi:hypothetical protein
VNAPALRTLTQLRTLVLVNDMGVSDATLACLTNLERLALGAQSQHISDRSLSRLTRLRSFCMEEMGSNISFACLRTLVMQHALVHVHVKLLPRSAFHDVTQAKLNTLPLDDVSAPDIDAWFRDACGDIQ